MANERQKVMVSNEVKRREVGAGMTVDEKLDLLVSKVSGIENDITGLKGDVSQLKSNVSGLKSNVSELKDNVCILNNKFTTLETAVTHIELNLENNLQVQIQRVAEGHLDLSRKMDGVIEINNELEMHSVQIGKLEYDISKMKQRFA